MATYLSRPVEIIQDFGNGTTRVKFLDASKPDPRKLEGESEDERYWRMVSHGILDVPTDRITED